MFNAFTLQLQCKKAVYMESLTEYKIGDTVTTKKSHACGSNRWQIIRVGADYKLKCLQCGRIVMLDSVKFHKAVKRIETK